MLAARTTRRLRRSAPGNYAGSGGPSTPGILPITWGTATGQTDPAILDQNASVPFDARGGSGSQNIVVTGIAGSPTTNCLKVIAGLRVSDNGAETEWCRHNLAGAHIPVPAVGNSLYYRVYVQNIRPDGATDATDGLIHPWQDGDTSGSQTNWEFISVTDPDRDLPNGYWMPGFDLVGNSSPINRFWPLNYDGGAGVGNGIAKNTWFRVEFRVHRIGTTTWNLHVKVYNNSGTQILGDSDFRNRTNTGSLGDTPTLTFNNVNLLAAMQIGFNGLEAGSMTGLTTCNLLYWAALDVSATDWLGAYA